MFYRYLPYNCPSAATVHARLLRIGFQVEPQEIFTALSAAKLLVQSRHLRPFLVSLLIGRPQGYNTQHCIYNLCTPLFHFFT